MFARANASPAFEARLDRRLFALAWTSLLVALASGAVWLVIVASNMSGQPTVAVLRGGVLGIVLTQTRFGQVWVIRAALVVVLTVSLAVLSRSRNRASGWVGLLAAGAFIASLAWAGHGAAAEDVPFDAIHLPADILHLLATGAWLGALLPLVLLLAAVRREGAQEELTVARAAALRFSILGLSCVGTLLVTGVVNTWFLAGSVPALIGTTYGQLLLVKITIFAAMIGVAGVNHRRLVPCLADVGNGTILRFRTCGQLCRNASIEVSLGFVVLAIVGIIGILTPGLHSEPRWPLPFRIDLSESPPIVRAYPTSFYASTQAYAAPSVARGAPLYSQNCSVCHGALGRGDGPFAGKLPVRPADLTEPHLFAHKVGDIYWWISNGRDGGVMPGFADKLTSDQRWDLINFVLARTSGLLARGVGSQISTTTALPVPDFAFEQGGAQNTLSQMLKSGPVLLVLFAGRATRLPVAAGLQVIAVGLGASTENASAIATVSPDVRTTLALFRSHTDGGETELMLDRNANVRARWTAKGAGGLPNTATLIADSERVATIPAMAANHAGHAH